MVRKYWLAALLVLSALSFSALAGESAGELVGSWKLTGWTVQVTGGDTVEPFGANPKGRIIVTRDGYWMAILTGANRTPAKTTEEKAALLDSVLAYAGKYTVDGDRVSIKVDMSSNEIYTGANQNQTRFFRIEGNRLTLRTAEMASAALPGKKVVVLLTCERE